MGVGVRPCRVAIGRGTVCGQKPESATCGVEDRLPIEGDAYVFVPTLYREGDVREVTLGNVDLIPALNAGTYLRPLDNLYFYFYFVSSCLTLRHSIHSTTPPIEQA